MRVHASQATLMNDDTTATAGGAASRLEQLAARYAQLIARIVRRVGGRRARLVEDDIAQRVLASIWQQLAREQTIDHPVSYIYRTAVRATIRVLREETRHPVDDLEGVDPVSPAADPHAALIAREQRAAILQALSRLAPDRRRAVSAHLAGFDVQEIMKMFNWSYNKARNLIARGTAELREMLKQELSS